MKSNKASPLENKVQSYFTLTTDGSCLLDQNIILRVESFYKYVYLFRYYVFFKCMTIRERGVQKILFN